MEHGSVTGRPGCTRRPARRTSLVVALLAAGALLLAACSSGSSDSGRSSAPRSEATTTTSSGASGAGDAAEPVVMTAESDLGTILVDREGFALYTFTSGGEPVPCSGACAAAWPPLVLPESQDEPEAEDSISGLSAVMTEGRTQVALNGLPLYRFSGDSEAGQVNGDGIVSFGGTWRVAIPAGAGASGASSDGSGSSGSSSGGAPGY